MDEFYWYDKIAAFRAASGKKSAHEKSLDAIREKNNGVLPNDLYHKTNAELAEILRDLTGKWVQPRTSKETLVKRIQRATGTGEGGKGKKRALPFGDENAASSGCNGISVGGTRDVLAEVNRKRLKTASAEALADKYTHAKLQKMWMDTFGSLQGYPFRSSKVTILQKMQRKA
uniref:Uncharacterized protein n=1 Tax=Chromera velia CCMP2878 TaxID=1169474 RepID=A0A0G4HDI4_9ALVE|mmetsp:Transcript_14598/g.29393  ORF Transcript_14598/g.29393 Transcript_14598/m.29393 type:complete len:173 (-) Transcript_14598:690-1208(-)|eukprot:Cvel_26521.t1-p1 / transcript=Cvel_26521.t1 / gene=Cvel_26521 / organism=Chromera_velia_CCMP2878 / gene_product=hypothetical protein / transcript_product=hypothetical protein / location=Cvel_scaffold3167:18188-18703(+) / protein_length=172 / sequence_SO=supercontig / SO=protein_coding / is_pseudo=false